MKINNLTSNTFPSKKHVYLTAKIALGLGGVLCLSSCTTSPSISYNAPQKPESTQHSYSPTLITASSSPQLVALQHPVSSPDITLEETHKLDINRIFHPIIWQEMQHKFHLSMNHFGKYESHIDFFKQKSNYLETVSLRAKPYLHYILSQVQLRDMPYEMALLPIIESRFSTHGSFSQRSQWTMAIYPQYRAYIRTRAKTRGTMVAKTLFKVRKPH